MATKQAPKRSRSTPKTPPRPSRGGTYVDGKRVGGTEPNRKRHRPIEREQPVEREE